MRVSKFCIVTTDCEAGSASIDMGRQLAHKSGQWEPVPVTFVTG